MLTEALVEKGAKVIGFDVSEVLVGYTKHKLSENPNCLIQVADFSQSLDFVEDGSFDLVVASLVLHYIEDWKVTLDEVTRILKQDGQFIFSIHHPLVDWKIAEMYDYFNFELIEDIWTWDDKKYKVQFYHRTLTNVFEAIERPAYMLIHFLSQNPFLKASRSTKIGLITWIKILISYFSN